MEKLTASLREEAPLAADGESSGEFSPPVHGLSNFKANTFSYAGTPNEPYALLAYQRFDDGRELGAALFVAYEGNELEVRSVGGIVGNTIYIGKTFTAQLLSWKPGNHINFSFTVDFKFENIDYHLVGKLLLRFE